MDSKMCRVYKLYVLMFGVFLIYANLVWASSSRTVSINTKTTASIVNIEYPQGFANEQINSKIRVFIDSVIKPYLDAAPEKFDPDDKNKINIIYSIESNSTHVISVIFYINSYMSGGAHPSTLVKTLNFIDGEEVSLEQLFKTKSNYLSTIFQYCYINLSKILPTIDKDYLNDIIEPTRFHYRNWFLNKTGLIIVFEPFSTFDPITFVTIPYTTLKKWPYTKKKIIERLTWSSMNNDVSTSRKQSIKNQTPITFEKYIFYPKKRSV